LQTISFYSYKGGSGRTLVVANMARYLARFGQKVVAIDFDLEAPGLHYKFSLDRVENPIPAVRGLVDYIHAFLVEGKNLDSLKIGDYVVPVPSSSGSKSIIHLIPAGGAPSEDYWHKLSRIDWQRFLYGEGARGVPFFLELKEKILEELSPDFLLIDARTGVTEIGGVATSLLPEKVVCLVLSTPENLEGARTVLRSLGRIPRMLGRPPMDIIAVLTRIPEFKEPDRENEVIAEVLEFLNQPAEMLEETLNITKAFVLHSEPDLQFSESLRIGGHKSPDESVLLRDYLRLFAHVIPADVIRPHIGSLLNQAKSRVFEDPDGVQKELESLTQFGHPDAYRELIKFYRLRNVTGREILRVGSGLWHSTHDASDSLLQETVRANLKEMVPESRYMSSGQMVGTMDLLRFVEDLWRSLGSKDVDWGARLADSYSNFGQRNHAADLLLELIRSVGPHEKILVQCMRQLMSAEREKDRETLIERFGSSFARNEELAALWAEHALARKDNIHVTRLLEPSLLPLVARGAPMTAIRLLLRGGQPDTAREIARRSIQTILTEGPSSAAFELGKALLEMGLFEEFEKEVRSRFDAEEADRLLRELQVRRRRFR